MALERRVDDRMDLPPRVFTERTADALKCHCELILADDPIVIGRCDARALLAVDIEHAMVS